VPPEHPFSLRMSGVEKRSGVSSTILSFPNGRNADQAPQLLIAQIRHQCAIGYTRRPSRVPAQEAVSHPETPD
jgi:hypothetical protein